ncbi:MAG: nucleotidyltransferase domain-containing protein [Clostridia bacterium]|nr:nucleotidyltransferase domain-containing protein [Clostridia bacterium]
MEALIAGLRERFGDRLRYVGLQGSYLRGEADENSDIDVMVVLDRWETDDLDGYRELLMRLGDFDRSCGFICGEEELRRWNPLECCHVLHSTKDYVGRLADFLPVWTMEDERSFIKMSLNNLWHELSHRRVHRGRERSLERLPGMYKGTFFILQNLHYMRTGEFINSKAELLERLDGDDRAVLAAALALRGGMSAVDADFERLLTWCQAAMQQL